MDERNAPKYKAWLRGYYRKSWWKIGILLFFSLIGVGLQLLNPWPLKLLADSVFGSVPAPGPLEPLSGTFTLLLIVAGIFIAIYLVGSFVGFLGQYLGTIFGFKLDETVKKQYFWHVLHLPIRDTKRLENADYVYRFNQETDALQDTVLNNTVSIITSAVNVVGVLVILIFLDLQMTLLSLIIVPFLFGSVLFFGKKLEKQSLAVEESYARIATHATESIESVDIVQSYNRQEGQTNKLLDLLKERLRLEIKSTKLGGAFNFTNSLLSLLSICVIVVLGGQKVFEGVITFGDLLIFITYAQQLYDPLQSISEAIAIKQDNNGLLKRVFAVISDHENIENTKDGQVIEKAKGQINFRNVSFSYKDQMILNGVNLDIKPGEKVGFIGPSGAGKSTFLSLISRFGIPDKGFIYIDGKETSTLNLKSLRNQIAIVSQEPKLFSISIGENIGFARPDENYPLPDVMAAASTAFATEFIEKLPNGYNTIVNGAGDSLSGGQKQRVAIARAVFKKSPILILDEPTSAQDVSSEEKVLDGINHLMKGKTVLMVTHKHSLLSAMDTIYVLEKGKLRNVKDYGGLDAYERYLHIHELKPDK